jgi:hypothetical protein
MKRNINECDRRATILTITCASFQCIVNGSSGIFKSIEFSATHEHTHAHTRTHKPDTQIQFQEW